ncbi:MAG: CobW family GTP-binding protein, partial [Beijerinckiaceae bacterium]
MTESLQRPRPMPFVILTGFLGAGKTTLLNRWLRDPALGDTLVLINEFGDVALDHLLVEAAADGMVLLPSGCVCCAVRGDLVTALEGILRRIDNGRMPSVARVVLETTGLADPVPVLATVLEHPYLKLRFAPVGVITVIDAVNGAATLRDHPVAVKQAALADMLLISKADLAIDGMPALTADLHGINPLAPVMDAADFALTDWQAAPGHRAVRPSEGRASPDAAPSVHEGIVSFTLVGDRPVHAASFDLFLDLLRAQKGPDLLRVKGLLALDDDPARPVVIHAAQHVLHPVTRLGRWPDA